MLILLRGLPGAGKTTLAEALAAMSDGDAVVTCADDFFTNEAGYKFEPDRIAEAHHYCQRMTREALTLGETAIVANTFTEQWEMEPYFGMALEFGVKIHTVIVENRHGGESVHGVPADAILRMAGRFSVKMF